MPSTSLPIELERPRGWKQPFTVGHYWRAALVVFFNYGVDTGNAIQDGSLSRAHSLASRNVAS